MPDRTQNIRAILAICAAFLALFTSVGFLNAFGVFQDYYQTHELNEYSASDISWIGSASISILYIASPLSGILADKLGPRHLVIGGSIGQLLAVFMASLCKEYYQFFLSQALLQGVSMAFVTWPPMASVSRHVPKRRGLALGIVVGGSSIGGVIWPIALQRLLYHHKIGFPWTMRIVGFIMLPLMVVVAAGTNDPPKPPPADTTPTSTDEPLKDQKAEESTIAEKKEPEKPKLFRNPTFQLLCLGYALAYFGLFIPFFYVSLYGAVNGVSQELSFYLISIMNGLSFAGRVLPGYLADKFGHFNLAAISMILSGLISFTLTTASGKAGLVIWSMAYGFASGAVLSLQAACAAKLATHETQGKAIGGLTGTLAITALVGTPIAGQLLGNYGFLALSMFAGATLLGGGVIVLASRFRVQRELLGVY